MPSAYFALILRGCGLSERDQAALLAGTDVTPTTLITGTDITLGQQLRQIRNAARVLDPSWSLQVGSRLGTAAHGSNGFAIATAPTLGHGIQVMERFAYLRAPHFQLRARCGPREVRMVIVQVVALSVEEQRVLVDLVMLSLQALLESLLGRPVEEARFEMPYPAPEHRRLFRDVYHGPVSFSCPEAACIIPARWLTLQSPFAEPPLHGALMQRLHAGARQLRDDRLLVARVERVLGQRGARLRIRQAARLLGVSERTLSRRLSDQGTSFHALVDNSLKSHAVALLHDPELTVAEVAYALGYTDPANFGRAFQRWFELSPGKYRMQLDVEPNIDEGSLELG
jgi:AraC-like DNA-binding protein